jgi:hypothetical protein
MNKVLYKIKINNFCDKFLSKFPKIKKETQTLTRLDKISIFEYFNFVEERKTSKPQEYLIKEIIDYMNSKLFYSEFKYTISDEEKRFIFLIYNISLLLNRFEEIYIIEKKKLNFKNISNFEYLRKLWMIKKMIFLFKHVPMKYFCPEILKFYIKENQIIDNYTYIIENELIKKFHRIDFNLLKYRNQFSRDLNKLIYHENETEGRFNNFKIKYIKKVLLKNENPDNILNEKDCDKVMLYFIAHVILLFII